MDLGSRLAFFGTLIGVGLTVCVFWLSLKQRPSARNDAEVALNRLEQAVSSADGKALLDLLVVPASVRDRTQSEQTEFVRKALQDEVSAEGVRVLAKEGVFGPLGTVFSNEAARWAGQAGVAVPDCVAFRMEKNGVVAEVAIATNGTPRLIRCNNVKQMAGL